MVHTFQCAPSSFGFEMMTDPTKREVKSLYILGEDILKVDMVNNVFLLAPGFRRPLVELNVSTTEHTLYVVDAAIYDNGSLFHPLSPHHLSLPCAYY